MRRLLPTAAGLKHRIRHQYHRLQRYVDSKRKATAFSRWVNRFTTSQSEVLIGANFDRGGGVRNHIHSIARYSAHSCLLIPDEPALSVLDYGFFIERSPQFQELNPPSSAKILHSHVSPWYIDWCLQHRKNKQLRWIHTHHALYFEDTEIGGLADWQKQLNKAGLQALRNCDLPLCVSPSQQRALRTLFGVDSVFLPNGVDVQSCDLGVGLRFRRTFRIDRPFVLWMGRRESVKNPSDILLAAAALPEVQFVVAVDCRDAEELQVATGVAVPGNVLLPGPLSRAAAQDALAACSLLVVTSLREGLPTLLLEALAHRCQIVTSDAEGCLDATDDGRLAAIYPRRNIAALCECISRAMRSPGPCERGRTYVLEKFDWKVVARKLDDYYSGRDG